MYIQVALNIRLQNQIEAKTEELKLYRESSEAAAREAEHTLQILQEELKNQASYLYGPV